MANYIQITFNNISSEQTELLVAELAQVGFEGFEEGERFFKAFIPADDLDETSLHEIANRHDLSFDRSVIEEINWNAAWESGFRPVIVDDFVAIRASFHEPVAGVKHEIIITPKMSFGTGHHATTLMMLQQMRKIDFSGKKVVDFGTGTGILAILAERLGAAAVIAIDNDDWSINNARENVENNAASTIQLVKADRVDPGKYYDIILANINKNVIVENFSQLVSNLEPKGVLLLSGLLETDETDILAEAGKFPLVFNERTTENNWIALRFTR
ncbi:MAG: 50S ribosomal protein L11 methyltransferase [Chitinophagaceae bacterium]